MVDRKKIGSGEVVPLLAYIDQVQPIRLPVSVNWSGTNAYSIILISIICAFDQSIDVTVSAWDAIETARAAIDVMRKAEVSRAFMRDDSC